jgi:hypothetical protein
VVYVLDGPVQADGYEWWLIVPVAGQFGLEPPPSGWVAARGQGEVWLAPMMIECEEPPTSGFILPSAQLVDCYGATELTLVGTLSGCTEWAGEAWQHGCYLRGCAPDVCETIADDPAVVVHFENFPARFEGPIRLAGHFDDPVAVRCGHEGDPLWRLEVFSCRLQFVATSYRFTD